MERLAGACTSRVTTCTWLAMRSRILADCARLGACMGSLSVGLAACAAAAAAAAAAACAACCCPFLPPCGRVSVCGVSAQRDSRWIQPLESDVSGHYAPWCEKHGGACPGEVIRGHARASATAPAGCR